MRFKLVSAALLSAVPGLSLGLGLGEETVRSYLNAPLNAEIELIATPEELSTLQARLAAREDFIRQGLEYPGFLTGIQVRTERLSDGRNILRLTSQQPVTEPFLVLLVEARTNSTRVMREFTLLLDPPTFQTQAAPPAPVAAPSVGEPAPPAPTPQVQPAPQPPPVAQPAPRPAPTAPAGGGGQYTVQRGDTLTNIAVREYGQADLSRALVAIYRANPGAFAGNMNVLRAGATLELPGQADLAAISQSEALAEVRSQMSSWRASISQPDEEPSEARLRLVPPASTGGAGDSSGRDTGTGTGTPAAGDDRPVALENPDLARIQQGQGPQAPAEPAPEPAPGDEVDASELGVTEPAPAPAAEPAPAARPERPAAQPAPEAEPVLVDRLMALVKDYWLYGAGAIVLIALLGALAARRRRAAATAFAPTAPSLDDFVLPGERDTSSDTFPLRKPTDGRDSNIVVEEASGLHERPVVRKETRTVDLEEASTAATMGTMALEQGDPLAEADFHMAYGLYDQAADLVKAALKREPERRDLKLKLLEVFFVWGNKDQFLQTARELAQTRDTAPPGEWEKVVIMGKQLAPEDVLFHQSAMGAQTSVDLNLEGGQNLVDFSLPDAGDTGIEGVDMQLGTTDTGLKPLDAEGGLDFMFDDAGRSDDAAPTATTRQMAQPGLDTINAPTVEQPALDVENTLAGKIGAHAPFTGSPDQTAELALDDLGLDLGKLEATGTGMLPPTEEAAGDAPTMVAGLDETSRELLASADASQRTEMLPLTDLDLSAVGSGLDMDLGGTGDTGRPPALDVDPGADLDLDVGAPDKPEGEWQATQRMDPGVFDAEAPKELEPVTMSEVGTKLDLARAYMDMGDPDGARSILNEVLQEGSDSQRQEAQRLLDSIPG